MARIFYSSTVLFRGPSLDARAPAGFKPAVVLDFIDPPRDIEPEPE
jgi:hypothetical protein